MGIIDTAKPGGAARQDVLEESRIRKFAIEVVDPKTSKERRESARCCLERVCIAYSIRHSGMDPGKLYWGAIRRAQAAQKGEE